MTRARSAYDESKHVARRALESLFGRIFCGKSEVHFSGKCSMPSLRAVATEAKLLLVGVPLLLWTMLPIYHLFLFAISPKESAFAGNLWPTHPTLHNFAVVFGEKHHFLGHFWLQLWNSFLVAVSAGAITLLIATVCLAMLGNAVICGVMAYPHLCLCSLHGAR